MRSRVNNRIGAFLLGGLLVALLLAPVPPGHATDGRDFAGFYEVSNVTDLGDTVRLTLTARVYNYSDADVADATVLLVDSSDLETNYGSCPDVFSIPDHESVRFASEFVVARSEYTRWENGGDPRLVIRYSDAQGQTVERVIEIAHVPSEVL